MDDKEKPCTHPSRRAEGVIAVEVEINRVAKTNPFLVGEEITEAAVAVGNLGETVSINKHSICGFRGRGKLTVSYGHMVCAAYVSSTVQS
jgi:hypothetical protein